MVDEANLENGQVVYEFPSGNFDVRAVLQMYNGKMLAHVRRFHFVRGGDVRAGKGISVDVEQLPELQAAVEALVEAAKARPAQ